MHSFKFLLLAVAMMLGFETQASAQITLAQAKKDHNLWFPWNGIHLVMGPEFTDSEQEQVARFIFSKSENQVQMIELGEGYTWWYVRSGEKAPKADEIGMMRNKELEERLSFPIYGEHTSFVVEDIFHPPTVVKMWAEGLSIKESIERLMDTQGDIESRLSNLKVWFETADLKQDVTLGFAQGWILTQCGQVKKEGRVFEIRGEFFLSPNLTVK